MVGVSFQAVAKMPTMPTVQMNLPVPVASTRGGGSSDWCEWMRKWFCLGVAYILARQKRTLASQGNSGEVHRLMW